MTSNEIMAELKKMGTAQNVKVYRRHGAGDNVFGVSFANLNLLKKKIKVNQAVAEQLWATGNVDARALAIMIADANGIQPGTADRWLSDIDYYMLADLFGGMIARAPFAVKKMKTWMASTREFTRACGYAVLASALRDGVDVSDDDCRRFLKTIEKEIHTSPNRARHSMNGALIAIGVYRPALTADAIAAAGRIGKVEVDHGETSCKTPDAVSYIEKTIARQKARAGSQAEKSGAQKRAAAR